MPLRYQRRKPGPLIDGWRYNDRTDSRFKAVDDPDIYGILEMRGIGYPIPHHFTESWVTLKAWRSIREALDGRSSLIKQIDLQLGPTEWIGRVHVGDWKGWKDSIQDGTMLPTDEEFLRWLASEGADELQTMVLNTICLEGARNADLCRYVAGEEFKEDIERNGWEAVYLKVMSYWNLRLAKEMEDFMAPFITIGKKEKGSPEDRAF